MLFLKLNNKFNFLFINFPLENLLLKVSESSHNSPRSQSTAMSDEAWFEQTSLNPLKMKVWVAMSRRRINCPIFFKDSLTAMRFRTQILNIFINDDVLQEGYFRQYGASYHEAHDILAYLKQFCLAEI